MTKSDEERFQVMFAAEWGPQCDPFSAKQNTQIRRMALRVYLAAVAAEREACAKVAEVLRPGPTGAVDTRRIHYDAACRQIAAAIRERGE